VLSANSGLVTGLNSMMVQAEQLSIGDLPRDDLQVVAHSIDSVPFFGSSTARVVDLQSPSIRKIAEYAGSTENLDYLGTCSVIPPSPAVPSQFSNAIRVLLSPLPDVLQRSAVPARLTHSAVMHLLRRLLLLAVPTRSVLNDLHVVNAITRKALEV